MPPVAHTQPEPASPGVPAPALSPSQRSAGGGPDRPGVPPLSASYRPWGAWLLLSPTFPLASTRTGVALGGREGSAECPPLSSAATPMSGTGAPLQPCVTPKDTHTSTIFVPVTPTFTLCFPSAHTVCHTAQLHAHNGQLCASLTHTATPEGPGTPWRPHCRPLCPAVPPHPLLGSAPGSRLVGGCLWPCCLSRHRPWPGGGGGVLCGAAVARWRRRLLSRRPAVASVKVR